MAWAEVLETARATRREMWREFLRFAGMFCQISYGGVGLDGVEVFAVLVVVLGVLAFPVGVGRFVEDDIVSRMAFGVGLWSF